MTHCNAERGDTSSQPVAHKGTPTGIRATIRPKHELKRRRERGEGAGATGSKIGGSVGNIRRITDATRGRPSGCGARAIEPVRGAGGEVLGERHDESLGRDHARHDGDRNNKEACEHASEISGTSAADLQIAESLIFAGSDVAIVSQSQ